MQFKMANIKQWLPDVQKLSILGRQPEERFRSTAEDSKSNEEMVMGLHYTI